MYRHQLRELLVRILRLNLTDRLQKSSASMLTWGIEGYHAPNNDWHFHRPHTFVSKSKKENFIEIYARKRKDLPAPTSYPFKHEWGGNKYKDCLGHSGQWLKAPKITMFDEILKLKKLKLPGPGQYKAKEFKILNMPKQNSEKGEFINNSRWYG
jgi:hypothetical protein